MKIYRIYSDPERENNGHSYRGEEVTGGAINRGSAYDKTSDRRNGNEERAMDRFLTMGRIYSMGPDVVHNLNNTLERIMISVGILRTKIPAGDRKAQKLLAIIESSTDQAGEVIKRIANNSPRIDERHTIDFNHIIDDIARAVRSIFPKEIYIDTDISPAIWNISGSPIDIYQILINLCVNARDAMPDGGELSISVKNMLLDDKRDLCADSEPGGRRYVCIRVADTGEGIPKRQLKNIFNPDNLIVKTGGELSGLDLFNVRKTVELYGGFITVESLPGRGTVFYLYFPVHSNTSCNKEG